jgi:CPA1 family monovalent cation:H+ antiporter
VVAVLVVFLAVIVLVAFANRIGVAYPIVLVLGGMVIGYIPGIPTLPLPPDLVLLIFLPPLLYWESVTSPTSEFRSGRWWIFQMAFGLVIVTTVAVAVVAHRMIPGMAWGVALVLGAIVSSTDEVAFSAVADRLRVPRHVIGTIEGESLINDATSLVLYSVGVGAIVGASFSFPHVIGQLGFAIVVAIVIGLAAGALSVAAWRLLTDSTLQGIISLITPFVSFLPAYYLNASGVLAVVVTGLFVNHFTPRVMTPRARETTTGFWVTIVFLLNAFIFVQVGIRFHSIVEALHAVPRWTLFGYGATICLTIVVVRILWTFAQGLLPITNEPEHAAGKPDWSHVAIISWAGMRGGVSVAAALAIPLETAAGPFPNRNLLIFLTFCTLLATLVLQGGSLPYLIRLLGIRDDGADEAEEAAALAETAKAALARIEELERGGTIPKRILDHLRARFSVRWAEFGEDGRDDVARATELYRQVERELLDAERRRLIALRDEGTIDNTVMRRIQRLLDLETEEVELLANTGHSSLKD